MPEAPPENAVVIFYTQKCPHCIKLIMEPEKLESVQAEMKVTVRPVCLDDGEIETSEYKHLYTGGGVPHIVFTMNGEAVNECRGNQPIEAIIAALTSGV